MGLETLHQRWETSADGALALCSIRRSRALPRIATTSRRADARRPGLATRIKYMIVRSIAKCMLSVHLLYHSLSLMVKIVVSTISNWSTTTQIRTYESEVRLCPLPPHVAALPAPKALIRWHYLSNTACFVWCVFRLVKDHHSLLHYSPLLKKYALDK